MIAKKSRQYLTRKSRQTINRCRFIGLENQEVIFSMTTLTIEFRGVTEDIINKLIERGYAKTKTEAVRYAILRVGEKMQLTEIKK